VYGISRHHQRPPTALIAAAKRVAAHRLPPACDHDDAYGVGFLAVHEGRDANFVFVNWWNRENELQRQVLWFERNAWVEKVLANPHGPDIEMYLKKRLSDQA
jgi:hypothetical protein